MSYVQNKLMELVSLQKFMELDAFISIMESMYEIDLNHASMRRQAQLRVTQLYKQVPVVAANLRFPDKYHVNLSVGKIANIMRQLIKTMVMLGNNNNIVGNDAAVINENEPINSFYSLLDEIRDNAYALQPEKLTDAGIHCRATFEEKYGFSWNA